MTKKRKELLLKILNSSDTHDIVWLDANQTIFKLDSIQSSGYEYINTNKITTSLSKIVMKCKLTELIDDSQYFFGYSSSEGGSGISVREDGTIQARPGSYGGVTTIGTDSLNMHTYTLDYKNNSYLVDGVGGSLSGSYKSSTTSVDIFGFNPAGSSRAEMKAKAICEKVEWYEDDVLTNSFIPAYNTSTCQCGLYDTINNVWYGNLYTTYGHFIGHLKDYDIIEYIESSGTQYIDTRYAFSSPTTLTNRIYKLTAQLTELSSFSIFGSLHNEGITLIRDLLLGTTTTKYQVTTGSNAGTTLESTVSTDTNKHVITVSHVSVDLRILVDNSYVNTTSLDNGTTGLSCYLFAVNSNGVAIGNAKMKNYQTQIYDGNKCVRNFIPARKNNEYFMIDISTENIVEYHNSGTGSFTGA